MSLESTTERGNKKQHSKKTKKTINASNENNENTFPDFLYGRWKIYRVSPMYNFSIPQFKFYEKKLNEELNSRKNSHIISFKSIFSLHKNINLDNEKLDIFQIQVVKDDSQTSYLGYFISWGDISCLNAGSVACPVLFVNSKPRDAHLVHSFLSKLFDCDIQPVTFSFYALITFFVKLLECSRSPDSISHEPIVLEYKAPLCEANDKIKISLFLESTLLAFALVMESLKEKNEGISNMDIICEFYNKIMDHVYNSFKVNCLLAELNKVVFCDAFLTVDGQVQMINENVVISALSVIKHFSRLDTILSM